MVAEYVDIDPLSMSAYGDNLAVGTERGLVVYNATNPSSLREVFTKETNSSVIETLLMESWVIGVTDDAMHGWGINDQGWFDWPHLASARNLAVVNPTSGFFAFTKERSIHLRGVESGVDLSINLRVPDNQLALACSSTRCTAAYKTGAQLIKVSGQMSEIERIIHWWDDLENIQTTHIGGNNFFVASGHQLYTIGGSGNIAGHTEDIGAQVLWLSHNRESHTTVVTDQYVEVLNTGPNGRFAQSSKTAARLPILVTQKPMRQALTIGDHLWTLQRGVLRAYRWRPATVFLPFILQDFCPMDSNGLRDCSPTALPPTATPEVPIVPPTISPLPTDPPPDPPPGPPPTTQPPVPTPTPRRRP